MSTVYQNHRNRWQSCQACELSSQRSRVVLARGFLPAQILMVGEAPGPSEDVIGRPFVGPAGKLLDRILAEAISAKHTYAITNLVACFPKEAKEAGINEPSEESIKACAPRLQEFIRLCKPKLVVLVGKLARKHIPWECVEDRLWCEVIHPAAILRMDISQRGLAVQRSIVAIADAIEEIA